MRSRFTGLAMVAAGALCLVSACTSGTTTPEAVVETVTENVVETEEEATPAVVVPAAITNLPQIDNAAWKYNADDDVFWQIGISYCENPADPTYETLGVFVPGAYLTATDNGDGTYTAELNLAAQVGGYTAETAPMVIPVNTPGYAAMASPTDYVSGVAEYTDAGFVYVATGARGKDQGAPAGVTDMKAAVRYLRYNEGHIPGSTERIFTFGMSGGGAQSALMGATGDSELYQPYLDQIGAVQGVSDAVAGAMCWCPITNLDTANEGYEWNLGVTRTGLSDEMQAISDGLAVAYAEYVNQLGLVDESGVVLTLEPSAEGIFQAGTYYEYIKGEIEQSLNNFLSDTTFPYTPPSNQMGPGGAGGPGGPIDFGGPGGPGGAGGPDGATPGAGPAGGTTAGGDGPDQQGGAMAGPDGGGTQTKTAAQEAQAATTPYATAQDYIDALNADGDWIEYDPATNTATITSVADFVKNLKPATKGIGAFDALDLSAGENTLFGYGDGKGAHFDAILAALVQGTEYEEAFTTDLARTDALGNTVATRLAMYTPMYYLSDFYPGYGTSNVAQYWRIRTGINQSDTALTTETNLKLALEDDGKDVDFAMVWGVPHVEAERTGDADTNFIAWVNEVLD